jgi:hypothetical protein
MREIGTYTRLTFRIVPYTRGDVPWFVELVAL